MPSCFNTIVSPSHYLAVNNGVELLKLAAQVGNKLIVAHRIDG